jgi:hypothetical protein
MGYRITYLPKDSDKHFGTHKTRLLVLTALFFLIFCLYTKQHDPKQIAFIHMLFSKFSAYFKALMESILLW